ncbi:MAG: histone deacetylase [Nannocystaceae bacterium]
MRLPRPLTRQIRRLRARARGWPLRLVYGQSYASEWDGMPFDPIRGERILTALAAAGLARRGAVLEPPPAMFKALRWVHSDAYLDSLTEPEGLTRIFGEALDGDAVQRVLDLQRSMAGGTILAAEWALHSRGVVANLGGGFHHAGPAEGAGFCVINDLAIAVATLRERGYRGKVLVVDLDLHDGNGTRACFRDDPSVFTLSIHNQHWGPTDAVASRSVELGADVDDAAYLAAIDEHLPEVIREHRPQLVFVVAGTDPAAEDPLGNWRITGAGMLARDQKVHTYLEELAPDAPRIVVLAGGYGQDTWKHSARALAWVQSGASDYAPPDTESLTLMRYRHLAKVMTRAELTGEEEEDDDNWGLSEADIFPGLGGKPATRRFLGFYAASGLELALERYGYLDRLRAKGYARPTVVVDTKDRDIHTIQIFGEPRREHVLLEVRLRRDRATIVGFELLFVEWLLLQHPAGRFTGSRPRLPGQEHPGLGLFSETVGLLLIMCERLRLDGLAAIPSQYHLAIHWRRHLRFVDPEEEAYFDALTAALADLPLAAQTQAVADARVWDENAGAPAHYHPSAMLLPLSERLRERLAGEAQSFAARRAAAAASLRLHLRTGEDGAAEGDA